MENLDLREYITPLLKWWWLICSAMLIASVSSYAYTASQPSIYRSRTTIMVNPGIVADPNPNGSALILAQQLAETYSDIAQRQKVRRATAKALGIQRLPAYHAYAIPRRPIIEILVDAGTPELAQVTAKELANQLILQSPAGRDNQERNELRPIQKIKYTREGVVQN
ncbi:hypothetical protein KFU94_17640 [Chloroflexi bacterium TSY]|nr:hypothetical protein [Chloroflexi bacterium TSY]